MQTGLVYDVDDAAHLPLPARIRSREQSVKKEKSYAEAGASIYSRGEIGRSLRVSSEEAKHA